MGELLQAELAAKVGQGLAHPDQTASRRAPPTRRSAVAVAVPVQRARARTRDGHQVTLDTYAAFAADDLLARWSWSGYWGLATRRHRAAVEPVVPP